jgi:membrane protein DedA with SNARE-associated domain
MKYTMKKKRGPEIIWYYHDFILLIISLLLAMVILTSDEIKLIVDALGSLEYIGIFIAGMFFSSGFTTAPAASVIFISSEALNPFLVAIIGALGAVFSDYLMFRVFRRCHNCFYDECKKCVHTRFRHISKTSHFHPHLNKAIYRTFHKTFQKISLLIAGIILASPLPDEIATLFYASIKINTKRFLAIAFFFKLLGVLAIALLARVL